MGVCVTRRESSVSCLRRLLLLIWACTAGCASLPKPRPGAELAVSRTDGLYYSATYDAASRTAIIANSTGKPGMIALHLDGRPRIETITTSVAWPTAPALAPGGRYLVHGIQGRADETARSMLFALDRKTGQSRILLDRGAHLEPQVVSISPNGERVAFDLRFPDGRSEIRVLELSTEGEARRITMPTGVQAPAWGPDSQALYFRSGRCLFGVANLDAPPQEVVCFPESHTPPRGPFPLSVSPDGKKIALTVDAPDCLAVAIVDIAGHAWSLPAPDECGYRPSFNEHAPGSLVYLRLDPRTNDRMAAILNLETGARSLTGIKEGVTFWVAPEPEGSLLAIVSTASHPPTAWRIHPEASRRPSELLYAPMSDAQLQELVENAGQTTREWVTAEDGARVPLVLFRPAPSRTIGRPARGPALLWIHGSPDGRGDVSPRWRQEIQYFLQLGYSVLAVNFRGSTGYGNAWTRRGLGADGKPDLSAMTIDLMAAARFLRDAPWADPQRVYVLSSSWGGILGARLVNAAPTWFRAAVQWCSYVKPWLQEGAPAPARSRPPLLILSGTLEPGHPGARQVSTQAADATAYRRLELAFIEDSHSFNTESGRAKALQRAARFLAAESGAPGAGALP